MSMVEIKNITSGYTKENIIEDISFDIETGELVGILGSNGSGKSTLVKSICNIIPHGGNVFINGNIIENYKPSKLAKEISYIPQRSGINMDISVIDVVMMGYNSKMKFFENPTQAFKENAIKILDLLGLNEKCHENYMNLSEGQKQLVIFARALVNAGNLIVMDEPESALDYRIRNKAMRFVKKYILEHNKAGLVILHDIALALNICDKIVLLDNKKIISKINLKVESLEYIENQLKLIYGDIKLEKIKDNNKHDNIVMIFNSEDI